MEIPNLSSAKTREEKREAIYAEIIDEIPESFWKMHFWPAGGLGWARGKLDVADRKTVIVRILEEAEKLDNQRKDDDPSRSG